MSGGRVVFEYKCAHGHITERKYPWRTTYESHAQILCPECLKQDKTIEAYIVFSFPEHERKNA